MDTLKVGSNIDAWCTKCKLVLAHTIEAIAQGAIKRVQCNTCKGKHQFKHEPGTTKPEGSVKRPSLSKTKSKASYYAKLMDGRDLSKAAGYNVCRHFVKGDMITHSKFGVGVVVEEKDISKIEVLFESGPKILIHARTL
jgi:hypothetical protein